MWVTILYNDKYPGRVLNKSDGDWLEPYKNLSKERKFWEYFGNILEREVTYKHMYGQFY